MNLHIDLATYRRLLYTIQEASGGLRQHLQRGNYDDKATHEYLNAIDTALQGLQPPVPECIHTWVEVIGDLEISPYCAKCGALRNRY